MTGKKNLEKTTNPKKVMVVGGGPGGMSAALAASLKGHKVTLYEQFGRLGGQLYLAAAPPGREDFSRLAKDLEEQLAVNEIPVFFNREPSLLFSVTSGRDFKRLARIVSPLAGKKYFVSSLDGMSQHTSCPQGFELIGIKQIPALVRSGGEFLVTGSFHLVGDVMKILEIAPYS